MKYDKSKPLHRLVLGGLLAAVVLLLTMAIAIPIPNMAGAYVNLGDVAVYLSAFLMGSPWGVLAAAIGSALADILLGSMLYAAPTFIIKGGMAFIAAKLFSRFSSRRFVALLIAGLLMPLGYFLFESALYGAGAAILGVPANLLQYAAGVVLALPVIRITEKVFPAIVN